MTGTTCSPAAGHYGSVARAVHWLIAGLAVIVVTLGWAAISAPRNTMPLDRLLLLHRSVGLTIFALMLFRALWRWRRPPPPLPLGLRRSEAGLARLTHGGLYAIFLVMPLAGYVNAAAAGRTVSFFGLASIPPMAPVDPRLSQWAIALHLLGQYVAYLLVSAHILGALYHGAIKRDGILDRMLPRRRRDNVSA
jgi:cytochrome b561